MGLQIKSILYSLSWLDIDINIIKGQNTLQHMDLKKKPKTDI